MAVRQIGKILFTGISVSEGYCAYGIRIYGKEIDNMPIFIEERPSDIKDSINL